MSLTIDEARVLIDFLDRVTLTGHQERANMNIIIEKVIAMGRASQDKIEKQKTEQKETLNATS